MTGHGHNWLCLLGYAHYWYHCYCCVPLLELILLSQEKDTLCYSLCYLEWLMDWLAVCQWFRLQAEFLKNTENSQVIRASYLLHSGNWGINFVLHFGSGLRLLESVWLHEAPPFSRAQKRQIVLQIFIIFIHHMSYTGHAEYRNPMLLYNMDAVDFCQCLVESCWIICSVRPVIYQILFFFFYKDLFIGNHWVYR